MALRWYPSKRMANSPDAPIGGATPHDLSH
jgi:hypothetical protein